MLQYSFLYQHSISCGVLNKNIPYKKKIKSKIKTSENVYMLQSKSRFHAKSVLNNAYIFFHFLDSEGRSARQWIHNHYLLYFDTPGVQFRNQMRVLGRRKRNLSSTTREGQNEIKLPTSAKANMSPT